MSFNPGQVWPITRDSLWELMAGLHGACSDDLAFALDVVPPPMLEKWAEVEDFDPTQAEFDAPCGFCWRRLDLHRLLIGSRDKFGVLWVGQCECLAIHYALPKGPVDLTIE
jgi:hypothetical protein